MAFNNRAFVRLSSGECSTNQDGATVNFGYESRDDDLTDTGGGQLEPGYFNEARSQLRFGSFIQLTYRPDVGPATREVVFVSSDDHGSGGDVTTSILITPAPVPLYETISEAPITFVTSGSANDNIVYPDCDPSHYALFSLNSDVTASGNPNDHIGIRYIECQAAKFDVFWTKAVNAGQNVKLWFTLKSSTPTP